MKKTIIARLSLQHEHKTTFVVAAKEMIQKSNAEKDCISYQLYEAIDGSSDFIFHEEYADQIAVDAHNASAHFKTFITLIGPMLSKEPIIEIF